MQFGQPFDARAVDPTNTFAPLPMGDYKVVIVASEPKENKDKTGGYLEFTLRVIEGQYLNREVPYRLNLWNQSQQSCEIAYKQLSAICHVTGVFSLQDSQQLHGIPFVATIGPQKSDPQWSEVKGVKDLNGNIPGKPGAGTGVAAAVPAQPAAAQPAAPAWAQPPAAQPAAPAAPAAPAWGPPAPAAPAAPQQPAPWGQPSQPAAPAAPAAPWQPAAPATAPAAPPWASK